MQSESNVIFIAKTNLFFEIFKAAGCTAVAFYFVQLFVDSGDKLSAEPIVFAPLLLAMIVVAILALFYWRRGLSRLYFLRKRIPLMEIGESGFSYVVDLSEKRFIEYKDIASIEIEKQRIPEDLTQLKMVVTKRSGDIEKIFLNDLATHPEQLHSELLSRIGTPLDDGVR